MKILNLSTLVLTFIVSLSAEARRDQRREGRQQGRIGQGIESGELTKHEARKLHRGQRRVDRAQEKAMSDGLVTDQEKYKLEKMQDIQSKRIYKEKHDAQKRESAGQPTPPVEPEQPTE